jgi:hypothetical protein
MMLLKLVSRRIPAFVNMNDSIGGAGSAPPALHALARGDARTDRRASPLLICAERNQLSDDLNPTHIALFLAEPECRVPTFIALRDQKVAGTPLNLPVGIVQELRVRVKMDLRRFLAREIASDRLGAVACYADAPG